MPKSRVLSAAEEMYQLCRAIGSTETDLRECFSKALIVFFERKISGKLLMKKNEFVFGRKLIARFSKINIE